MDIKFPISLQARQPVFRVEGDNGIMFTGEQARNEQTQGPGIKKKKEKEEEEKRKKGKEEEEEEEKEKGENGEEQKGGGGRETETNNCT